MALQKFQGFLKGIPELYMFSWWSVYTSNVDLAFLKFNFNLQHFQTLVADFCLVV